MNGSHMMPKAVGVAVLCVAVASLPLAARAADSKKEIATAAQHAGLAAKAKNVQMVHTHMHHALNCLVGPSGEGFDAKAANPCKSSGNGAISDTGDQKQKMALEGAAKTLRMGLNESDLAAAQKTAMMAQQELKKAAMKK